VHVLIVSSVGILCMSTTFRLYTMKQFLCGWSPLSYSPGLTYVTYVFRTLIRAPSQPQLFSGALSRAFFMLMFFTHKYIIIFGILNLFFSASCDIQKNRDHNTEMWTQKDHILTAVMSLTCIG
jgi:hypothetical protein